MIGRAATLALGTDAAEVRQLPGALAERLRRGVVEQVERGAVGEVAEVVFWRSRILELSE